MCNSVRMVPKSNIKWANPVGDMAPIDLLNEGLLQTFNWQNTQYLKIAIKQSEIKWSMSGHNICAAMWYSKRWGGGIKIDIYNVYIGIK